MEQTLKRKLAKMGIGNPLEMLLYTTQEIEDMRKQGMFPKFQKRERKVKVREPNTYQIMVGKFRINKVFKTWEEAMYWAKWNYKGQKGWKVTKN
jgi:hypothetical protein